MKIDDKLIVSARIRPRMALAMLASAALAACGGGGGGGTGGDPDGDGPPGGDGTITASMRPQALTPEGRVPTQSPFGFNSNVALDTASVTAASFSVRIHRTGDAVPGNLSFTRENRTALFTPVNGWALNAQHDVTAANTIRGARGETFAGYARNFDSADGTWENSPKIVSRASASGANSYPYGGVDAAGNAIAVYVRVSGGNQMLFANHLSGTTNEWWGQENQIPVSTEPVIDYRIAVNRHGMALAIWTQRRRADDPVYEVWSSWSHTTTPDIWSDPVRVNTGNTDADALQLAISDTGDALALWRQRGPNAQDKLVVHAAPFNGQTKAWTAIKSMEDLPRDHGIPHLAGNDLGEFRFAWVENNEQLFYGRYSAATSQWLPTLILNSVVAGTTYHSPRVAITPSNTKEVVAYLQRAAGGAENSIWSVALRPASPIGPKVRVKPTTAEKDETLELAMDQEGYAIAVWNVLHASPGFGVVYASRLDDSTGAWSTPEPISPAPGGGNIFVDAVRPMIHMDKAGNATAAWRNELNGRWAEWCCRFDRLASRWGGPSVLNGYAQQPGSMAMDPIRGHFLRMWSTTLGTEEHVVAEWFR